MGSLADSPTAKTLRTLEYLQIRPGINSDELAERLEVSNRAVRRYIAILREAGIPIDSTRGPYGGYRLGRGLRQPPLVFTASEAAGLVMAVLDGHHAAADPDDPVGAALGKLIRSLPSNIGHQAARIRNHALAAPDRRAARPDPATTSALVDAIAAQRRVRLSYTPEAGDAFDAEVDPWAIVVRHGRWYLLCHAHHVDGDRTYRVDRIQQIDTLDTDAGPPPDLDPLAWLEQHLGTGWRYSTHVCFDAPIGAIAPLITPPMGTLEASADGTCVLRGTTNNPAMYAGEWLAAIPHPFRIIGGPELRQAVTDLGRRLTRSVE